MIPFRPEIESEGNGERCHVGCRNIKHTHRCIPTHATCYIIYTSAAAL